MMTRLRSERPWLRRSLSGCVGMVYGLGWLWSCHRRGMIRVVWVPHCVSGVFFGQMITARRSLAATEVDAMIVVRPFFGMPCSIGGVGHGVNMKGCQRAVGVYLGAHVGV